MENFWKYGLVVVQILVTLAIFGANWLQSRADKERESDAKAREAREAEREKRLALMISSHREVVEHKMESLTARVGATQKSIDRHSGQMEALQHNVNVLTNRMVQTQEVMKHYTDLVKEYAQLKMDLTEVQKSAIDPRRIDSLEANFKMLLEGIETIRKVAK